MRNVDYHTRTGLWPRICRLFSSRSNHHFSFLISHSSFLIHFSFAIAIWAFFQFWYPYHFFYQEQNQIFLWSWDYIVTYFDRPGGVAQLVGDFLTQFYYYLFAGAAILTLCLLATSLFVYKALRNFQRSTFNVLLPLLLMVYMADCHLNVTYRLASTITIMGWAALLWAVSAVKGWKWRSAAAVVALAIGYLLFGTPDLRKPQKPNFALEDTFAVDCEYYFGNYDKVISKMESASQWTDEMLFFYNLVQAQRDQLPEHLLRFTPTNLGTFNHIGPNASTLTIRNQNELYWVLGDMTMTERAAMMTNVFSYNNRNVRMIRRLAECNIVSGDSLAAEKYLRLLDKTLVHRRWAQWARANARQAYQEKIRLTTRFDTITTTDNAHFLMMQLLDQHPDCPEEKRQLAENTVALDYIFCSNLLLKDIANFKRDYDRYCSEKPRLKTLYQEALCIWLAGSEASAEEWHRYAIRDDVRRRFIDYSNHRGDPRFKGTYWYYFDKIKAPEV